MAITGALTIEEVRQVLSALQDEFRPLVRNKAEVWQGQVVEVIGSTVRVARGDEPTTAVDLLRPPYPVVGSMPSVGAQVWVASWVSGGIVLAGGDRGKVVGKKSADQSFTSTTFANVTDMAFSYGPNEAWEFEFNIYYRADPSDDIKMFPDVTGAANLYYTGHSLDTSAISAPGNLQHREPVVFSTTPITVGGPSASTTVLAVIKGVVIGNATGGALTLRAAKNSATSANNAVISLFSNFIAHKVG